MAIYVRFIVGISVVLLLCSQVDSLLVREPVNVFTVRGTSVNMSCYTNLTRPVSWEVERIGGGTDWENFYKGSNGYIPDVYQSKYNVSVDSTRNQYNLTIKNVQPEDSGTYRCGVFVPIAQDLTEISRTCISTTTTYPWTNMGLSLWHYKKGIPHNGATAELVVIEDELSCWQETAELYWDPDTFDSMSVIKMICNVTYRGNIPPTFRWSLLKQETDGSGTSLQNFARSALVSEGSNFILSSELVMNGLKAMNQSYIKYEISGLYEESLDLPKADLATKISWQSDKIRMTYAETASAAHALKSGKSNVWFISGFVLAMIITVVVAIVLFLVLLQKRGYKFAEIKKFYNDLPQCPRIPIQVSTNDQPLLMSCSVSAESEELKAVKQKLQEKKREVVEQASELAQLKSVQSEPESLRISFRESQLNNKKVKLQLGLEREITRSLRQQLKKHGSAESYLSPLSSLEFIEHNEFMEGITVVDSEIFVMRSASSTVNVYDSSSLVYVRDIHIPDMKYPLGIAGCTHNKVVYISDQHCKCIHKINVHDDSDVIDWKLGNNRLPCRLAVTKELTLLVTAGVGDKGECVVVEFSSNGEEIREIALHESIKGAFETVQLFGDLLVVSHYWDYQRVCVIDTDGHIIKSHGSALGGNEDQWKQPYALTIDDNSKHIFVTDCFNRRVVMFNSDLTFLGNVHMPSGLKEPYRVYFDSLTNRLYVGERSGRLIVSIPSKG